MFLEEYIFLSEYLLLDLEKPNHHAGGKAVKKHPAGLGPALPVSPIRPQHPSSAPPAYDIPKY